ncbi:PilC/PilY family type IV pilus protein [candidate division CSSED10-310 bacterium]|uniref:PilC/PilY family type IV pilus protein n=1 Tax=candidate division CSSED10-310 bacterium TaxID=2855610 RepID=A0ABV6Z127_UNCC1
MVNLIKERSAPAFAGYGAKTAVFFLCVLLFQPAAVLAQTTICFDGFEFGLGAQWDEDGGVATSSAQSNTDANSMKIPKNKGATYMCSTVGWQDIIVRYYRLGDSLDGDDYLDVNWSIDGATWHNIETPLGIYVGWVSVSIPLSAVAGDDPADNANFQIRFDNYCDSCNVFIDDLEILGSPPPTATSTPTATATATPTSIYTLTPTPTPTITPTPTPFTGPPSGGDCVDTSDNFNSCVSSRWTWSKIGGSFDLDLDDIYESGPQGSHTWDPSGAIRLYHGKQSNYGGFYGRIFDTQDTFYFVHQGVSARKFDVTVKITDVNSDGTGYYPKGGLMIRAGRDWSDAHVMLNRTDQPGGAAAVPPASEVIQWGSRPSYGAATAAVYANIDPNILPLWLKITRNGDVFEGWYAADGANWTSIGTYTLAFSDAVLVGMAWAGDEVMNEDASIDPTYYIDFDNFQLCQDIYVPPVSVPPADCDTGLISLSSDPSLAQVNCLGVGYDQNPFFDMADDRNDADDELNPDHHYFVTFLPQSLKELIWIRTRHQDRFNTSPAAHIQFSCPTDDITVYVAYNHDSAYQDDFKPNDGPNWLTGAGSGWSWSYDRIGVRYKVATRADPPKNRPTYWDVWERVYAAGDPVTLGANRDLGDACDLYAPGMYFVLIRINRLSPVITYPNSISNTPPFFVNPPSPKVMILYDNSGSMYHELEGGDEFNRVRGMVGRDVLVDIVDNVRGVDLGLATYLGHKTGQFMNPYPGVYTGCEPLPLPADAGSMPMMPENMDDFLNAGVIAPPLNCTLTDPCDTLVPHCDVSGLTCDTPTSAQILQHIDALSDVQRWKLKYGSNLYEPYSNQWLKSFHTLPTSSCFYHNMQGVEGINRNVLAGYGGWTPIAGSMQGVRDYFIIHHLPNEDPAGMECTGRYVILVTDGLETCQTGDEADNPNYNDTTNRTDMRQAALDLKVIPYGGNDYKVKTFVVALGNFDDTDMDKFNEIAIAGETDADLFGNEAFMSRNSSELLVNLHTALNEVIEGTFAGSAVAVEMDSVSGRRYLYRATFFPKNWHGEIDAFPLDADGLLDPLYYPDNPEWSVNEDYMADHALERAVYTSGALDSSLVDFAADTEVNAYLTPDEIDYIMGDPRNEVRWGGTFRNRHDGPLGDIIHSSPLLVSAPPFSYNFDDYKLWAESSALLNRTPMLYFGCNDGFYHGVDASSTDGGVAWSYCPRTVIPKLVNLVDPTYVHDYYVDGPSSAHDIYFTATSEWKTIAIVPLRAGGQAYHMIDVTDPADPKLHWVIENNMTVATDSGTMVLQNMIGYSTDRVKVVRVADVNVDTYEQTDAKWVLLISSGLENGVNAGDTEPHGYIMAFDLVNRQLIDYWDLGEGHECVSFSITDINADEVAEHIYAGDMVGCVWRIDIEGAVSNWDGFRFTQGQDPEPLFYATDSGGVPQPISSPIEAARVCHDDVQQTALFFGTGKFLHGDDRGTVESSKMQSMYTVVDNDSDHEMTRADLGEIDVFINGDGDLELDGYYTYMDSMDAAVMGHYIDYDNFTGERLFLKPTIAEGVCYYISVIPTDDRCSSGGWSVLYGLPFYASCIQAQDKVDLSDQVMVSERTNIVVGTKFVFPGNLYLSDAVGNIKIEELRKKGATVQPRSWKEVIE